MTPPQISNDYLVRLWRNPPRPGAARPEHDLQVAVAADSMDTAIAATLASLDFTPAQLLARRAP